MNIYISHHFVVYEMLPSSCLPVLRIGNCGNCNIFLGREFLLNASLPSPERPWNLFRSVLFFLKNTAEMAVSPLPCPIEARYL